MKTTQHQFRVKVSGIPGTFNTFSGGGMERESTQSWNGGSPNYDNLSGPATYANIEVSRPHRLSDEEWLSQWRNGERIRRATVTKQPLDENLVAVGKPVTYEQCLLVGLSEPDTEAGSAAEAMVSLTFATTGPAR
ncbi:hypothetical protein [Nesterenkonia sp. HG001]|uniref:hypothetical protein n=1 Tax=Nesterenkonia sp. HG001 TaxID=2983207 RepID=UPI002AC7AC63|nr:hypothetical protein [Nesterenkonia sp. HG001]MDZ5076735.1 hypothetical protein [Nesterenkonia sp. HG001]